MLKRCKAGHLSREITKIYRRLNEHCKDCKFLPEVRRSEAHRLDAQISSSYYLMEVLRTSLRIIVMPSTIKSIMATSNQ